MNNNAKAWIDALRSGKYKQTNHVLHDENGYCYLGIACELAVEAGIVTDVQSRGDHYIYDGYNSMLPPSVQQWLGLRTNEGHYHDDQSLASANDSGLSFEEIANIIESQSEGLFT